jgi:hypothetical protein
VDAVQFVGIEEDAERVGVGKVTANKRIARKRPMHVWILFDKNKCFSNLMFRRPRQEYFEVFLKSLLIRLAVAAVNLRLTLFHAKTINKLVFVPLQQPAFLFFQRWASISFN